MPIIEKTTSYLGVRPVRNFPVSLEFGAIRGYWKKTKEHRGVDFACPVGTPIFTYDLGSIEFAGNKGDGFGNYVRILHPNGYKSFYCHLDQIFVGEGDKVKRGSPIASSGVTGNATGPHLHFELRNPQGKSVNPAFEKEFNV